MNGKQHLVSGGALCGIGIAGLAAMPWAAGIREALGPDGMVEAAMCGACYFTGCLLPDIDQPQSLLGRYVHVEAEHRTWTHSIYPLLALLLIGQKYRPVFWMALGVLAHLFMDSFSKCGVAWFRCFDGYRKYGSGAKIRKGWHPVLYTNEVSAWIVCTVLVMLAIWACWAARKVLFGDWIAAGAAWIEKTAAFLQEIPGKAAETVSSLWPF